MTAAWRANDQRSWRWFAGSPLPIAAWVSLFLVFLAVRGVAEALRRAEVVRREALAEHAWLAAETVAMRVDAAAAPPTELTFALADTKVVAQRRHADWLFASTMADGSTWRFRGELLRGGAPMAFAEPMVATDPAVLAAVGAGRSCRSEDLPQIDAAAIAFAGRTGTLPAFRRDPGIALLHWDAGTEADDFVLDGARLEALDQDRDGLAVVPGHLWIGEAAEPLQLALDRDLVVVVQGNLYIGRSITVTGSGRLLFATVPGPDAMPFADLDGNGRWSAGDQVRVGQVFRGIAEGGGNVYLGFARCRSPLRLLVGVVAGGEVHVAGDVTVEGPLVVPFGLSAIGPRPGKLRATGQRLYRVGRELVPGFRPQGEPRIALLRPVGADPRALPELPLDASAPAR